jgi:hypothetical protein
VLLTDWGPVTLPLPPPFFLGIDDDAQPICGIIRICVEVSR